MSGVLARFPALHAVVLGDPILDGFLTGAPTRLCTERPVPVLVKAAEENRPGGAANTAANVRAMGAGASLVGLLGADPAAGTLRDSLQRAGVEIAVPPEAMERIRLEEWLDPVGGRP